jgi:hypothetical protein
MMTAVHRWSARPASAMQRELSQGKKGLFTILLEGEEIGSMEPKYQRKLFSGAVPATNPDDFQWRTKKKTALVKISVLRDDGEGMVERVLPDRIIIGSL